jgi:3-isopropylmalate dehydratase small subunit
VLKGPNIKPVPRGRPVDASLRATVLLKLGDKVSTDDISPSGTAALVFRSNVPAIAEFTFKNVDADFVARARAAGDSVLVGGEIYGQGSSREAAVLSPLHLGVRAVLAKSFARIHRANLINWGLVPLEFDDAADYDTIAGGDVLRFPDLRDALLAGRRVAVVNERSGKTFRARCVLTPRERDILLAGGLLAQTAAAAPQESGQGRGEPMTQRRIPAVYMRGGTSRCLVFHERDLPPAGRDRDAILLAALGSPDPSGRQLDGLGGGISSLSKAVIIGPSAMPGADVDYTFAQVEVRKPEVDYTGNCGNCSSAVGPFAIEEHLVHVHEGETIVRIHNTNTKKLIVARVPVQDGEPRARATSISPAWPASGPASPSTSSNPAARARVGSSPPAGRATPSKASRPRWWTPRSPWCSCARTTWVSPARSRPPPWTGTPRSARGSRPSASPPPSAWAFPAARPRRRSRWSPRPLPSPRSTGSPTTRARRTWWDAPSPWAIAIARSPSPRRCASRWPRASTAASCTRSRRPSPGADVRLGPSLRRAAAGRRRHAAPGGDYHAKRVTVYRTARRLMEGWVRIP